MRYIRRHAPYSCRQTLNQLISPTTISCDNRRIQQLNDLFIHGIDQPHQNLDAQKNAGADVQPLTARGADADVEMGRGELSETCTEVEDHFIMRKGVDASR